MTWHARSSRSGRLPPEDRMQGLSWHLITGEYAPAKGGVADYTRALASALAAAGDSVHVWAPSTGPGLTPDPGVHLHPLPHGFQPRGLRRLSRELDCLPGPKRILVQYVPHAFGMRAMNLPFCGWVAALRKADVWIMFHEVALPWIERQAVEGERGRGCYPHHGESPGRASRSSVHFDPDVGSNAARHGAVLAWRGDLASDSLERADLRLGRQPANAPSRGCGTCHQGRRSSDISALAVL